MLRKITLFSSIFFISLFVNNVYAVTVVDSDNIDLTLNISNIKSQKGTIHVAMFISEKDYRKSGNDGSNAFKTANAKIDAAGTIKVIFKGIPSGTYAIKLFQDENGSGTLNTTLLGTPKEDFGFSNNIDAKSGEPDFDQIKFKVDTAHSIQDIKMQRALAS